MRSFSPVVVWMRMPMVGGPRHEGTSRMRRQLDLRSDILIVGLSWSTDGSGNERGGHEDGKSGSLHGF